MVRSDKKLDRILALLAILLVSSLACNLTVSLDNPSTDRQIEDVTRVVDTTRIVEATRIVAITQVVVVTQVVTLTPNVKDDSLSASWQKQSLSPSPAARKLMGFAYDIQRGLVVAVGGTDWITAFGDTWEYDGVNWMLRVDVEAMPGRLGSAMAYDSSRNVIVLFGGSNLGDNAFFNETWEYDGRQWEQQHPAHNPPLRNGAAMAYDPIRQSMVLFGGYKRGGSPSFYDDTWEYIDGNWVQRFPAHHPEAREAAHMVYDTARRRMVLFGGGHDAGSVNYNDTWEWNGEDWLQRLDIPNSPSPRWAVSMAYDEDCQRTILFGGLTGLTGQYNETWTFNGVTWTQISTSQQPFARWDGGLAYDRRNRRMVLFGGQYWNGQFGFMGDTWHLQAACD